MMNQKRYDFKNYIPVDICQNNIKKFIIFNLFSTAKPDLNLFIYTVDESVLRGIHFAPPIYVETDCFLGAQLYSSNCQNSCSCSGIQYIFTIKIDGRKPVQHQPCRCMITGTKCHFWIYF